MKIDEAQADFIEEQARLRMGPFYNPGDPSFSSRIRKFDTASAEFPKQRSFLIIKSALGQSRTLYANSGGHYKNEQFAEDVNRFKTAREQFYVADFQDCVPWRYEPFESAGIPVFGKNRPVEGTSPIILWTNRNYRGRREAGLAGKFNAVPWSEKKPSLIWRGAPHGHLWLPDGRHIFPPQLLAACRKGDDKVGRMVRDVYGTRDFCTIVDRHLVRYTLVSKFSKKYDVAFSGGDNQFTVELLKYIKPRYAFSERVPPTEVAAHKYLLILGGNDAGTQINWALSSNSVILMPGWNFDSTVTLGLREWVHYVPLAKDLGDFEEKLDWCRTHDEECREIARNASAYAALFQPHVEDAINRMVLKRYGGGGTMADRLRTIAAYFSSSRPVTQP